MSHYPESSNRDRTVHAICDDVELVRYDRAGKWYLETPQGRSGPLTVMEAATIAHKWIEAKIGRVVYGMPGGNTFERRVRGLMDGR